MSLINDIVEKREKGALQDALAVAQKALTAQPDDIDTKKAAAGVYYDLVVASYESGKNDEAIKYYQDFVRLDLPEEEATEVYEMFRAYHRRIHPEYSRMQEANKLSKSGKHEEALAVYEEVLSTLKDYTVAYVNVGWCLYRLLAEMAPKPIADVPTINKCFNIYKQFEIMGASNLHSQMLRIALYFKEYPDVELLDFLNWWDFNNFREEDLEPFRAGGGNTIPSLRERAFLTYAKLLVEGLKVEDETRRQLIEGYSEKFIPILEDVLPDLPRNVWLPYALMRLLVQMDRREEVEGDLLAYIKTRANEFWAWAALAEVYRNVDDGKALACYCKALLLPAQGELAVFVREMLSSLLIKHQLYNEARGEIDAVVLSRSKKQWKFSTQIAEWRKEVWYRTAKPQGTNKQFYIRNAPKADLLLWADIPDSIAVVVHVDHQKLVFYYAVDKQIGGKQMMKGIASRIQIGDILALKLKEMETAGNTWYKVVSMRPEKERLPEEITMWVDEYIQIPRGRDFGFMKPSNIYVGPEIVKGYRLQDNQRCQGIALLAFNKQKNEWNWKMLTIEN